MGKTSFVDDYTTKRAIYENLGIAEYWVVDVENARILAFEMIERGSRRTDTSVVFPRLSIALLEETLSRAQEADQSQVGAWLMTQFQG